MQIELFPVGRIQSAAVAKVVGCHPEDIPDLVAAKLLMPLGKPNHLCEPHFAAVLVYDLARNPQWLGRVEERLSRHKRKATVVIAERKGSQYHWETEGWPIYAQAEAIPRTGRIPAEVAAKIIGCGVHDIPTLIAAKLLTPLGDPSQGAVKFFAAVVIHKLAADPDWLGKVTNALYRRWKKSHALHPRKKQPKKPNKKTKQGDLNHESESK